MLQQGHLCLSKSDLARPNDGWLVYPPTKNGYSRTSKTKASAFGICTITRTGEQTEAKQPRGELVVIEFNYDLLETKLADKVRSTADRIRDRIKKTVEDIIEVGNDLLAVKEALPHGQFLPWLKADFGWGERSAQNFMVRD